MKSVSCSCPTCTGRLWPADARGDDAVAADRDRLRAVGNADARLHTIAARGHHLALRVQLEVAVTRVAVVPSGIWIWKKPRPSMATSSALSVWLKAALRVDLLGGDDAHTGAEMQAGGRLRVLRGRAADLPDVLVQQVLEHGAAFLEARGADVREVVRGDGMLRLLRVETGLGGPECWIHVFISLTGQPRRMSCAAAAPFSSAVRMAFTCISKWRASSIMLTIASAALTLLVSSAPDAHAYGGIGRRVAAVLHAEQPVVAARRSDRSPDSRA